MGHSCSRGDGEADKDAEVGKRRWGANVGKVQCIICICSGLSFAVVIVVVSVVESQESGGGDVIETVWHVGQQLPHI